MTTKEIKLELCKSALQANVSIERVEQMYDWIMKGEEVGEDTNTKQEDISLRPISELVCGIRERDHGLGLSTRLSRIASAYEIDTIGDLLKMGRCEFSRIRNVGLKLLMLIDDTLERLYGIKNW